MVVMPAMPLLRWTGKNSNPWPVTFLKNYRSFLSFIQTENEEIPGRLAESDELERRSREETGRD